MMEARKRNPKIYLICGKARHGKDSMGDIIRAYYEEENKKASVLKFAYYIKDYAKQLTGWDGGEEDKPRTLLQELGTEIIRNQIDPNFFIHRLIEDIQVFSFFFDVLTIADGRFEEEITSIKKAYPDAVTIFVERPGFVSNLTDKEQQHVTETGLNQYTDYDYRVVNDGTLEDLKEKTIQIVKEVEHEN